MITGTSVQQSVRSGRISQAAATGAAAGSAVAAASISKLLEVPKRRCVTLSQVTIQYSNQLWKVQTGRTHTISSTETSSLSALSVSVGQNSRQVLVEHHEEMFGKTAQEHKDICSGWLRFRREVMCTEASYSYICKASSCTVVVTHECRTKNPNAE